MLHTRSIQRGTILRYPEAQRITHAFPAALAAMVGSWIDLAKLVSSSGKEAGSSEFATSIGAGQLQSGYSPLC